MSGSDLPGNNRWTTVLETTVNGCQEPTQEDSHAASHSSNDSDWSSAGSNSSSENEAIGHPKVSPGSEGSTLPGLKQSSNSQPARYLYKSFTASPLQSGSRQRDQWTKDGGIQTPPLLPTSQTASGQKDIDPRIRKPRTANDPLNLKDLKVHFPDWSQEKIEEMIPKGERYRDAAYSRSQVSEGSNAQDPEDNESNKPQDGPDPENR